MTTSPVLVLDSTEKADPSKGSKGECRDFAGALFLLSRKLLALQAFVNRNGWRGSAANDEAAANHLLNLCVSRIIEISKMPNTIPEITQKVIDAYAFLNRVESNYSTGTLNKFPCSTNQRRSVGLTRREVEVVRHLAEGKCNKEIAAALGISVKTVETYRTRIMPKVGAHSLSDVTRFAVRHGIITILLDHPS